MTRKAKSKPARESRKYIVLRRAKRPPVKITPAEYTDEKTGAHAVIFNGTAYAFPREVVVRIMSNALPDDLSYHQMQRIIEETEMRNELLKRLNMKEFDWQWQSTKLQDSLQGK